VTDDAALALLQSIVDDLGLTLEAPLTLDADLRRLGIDSIDLLDVLFEVNERCGLALTVDDLLVRRDASRVATLVASITTAMAARAARGGPGPSGGAPVGADGERHEG
jgi:acyl carrier protein